MSFHISFNFNAIPSVFLVELPFLPYSTPSGEVHIPLGCPLTQLNLKKKDTANVENRHCNLGP